MCTGSSLFFAVSLTSFIYCCILSFILSFYIIQVLKQRDKLKEVVRMRVLCCIAWLKQAITIQRQPSFLIINIFLLFLLKLKQPPQLAWKLIIILFKKKHNRTKQNETHTKKKDLFYMGHVDDDK